MIISDFIDNATLNVELFRKHGNVEHAAQHRVTQQPITIAMKKKKIKNK